MGLTLSMEECKNLRWIRIPRDCRARWRVFSPMLGRSSSISWIKLSSSLPLISVYLSVISYSCLFVRNVRSDTHKISAIFFHVNPKSLRPSSYSLCISYLGLPCLHVPIISKRHSSSFILLVRKLSTLCIPRTKSAGKSNSYTICAKRSDSFIRSQISAIVLFLQLHTLTDYFMYIIVCN